MIRKVREEFYLVLLKGIFYEERVCEERVRD